MATFVALYGVPEDPDGFEEHFRSTHIPIVERWPGLQSWSATRCDATPRGAEPAYHLVFTATFASRDDLHEALRSDAGAESARDARAMAERFGASPTMLVGDDL